MTVHPTFQAANDAFYTAFSSGNVAVMDSLWSDKSAVFCCHPGWPPILNRSDIIASWQEIFSHGAPRDIAFIPLQMSEVGGVGIACGIEILGDARFACTNLFTREGQQWRMVHHHAGPLAPGMLAEVPPKVDPGRNVRH